MTNPDNDSLGKIEAALEQVEPRRPSWEKDQSDGRTLKEVAADLRKNMDLAGRAFNGEVTGFAHGASDLADRITKNLTIIGKGLEHAGQIPGLGAEFLQDVHHFKEKMVQYGKDLSQRVPQDIWAGYGMRAHTANAEARMANLGNTMNLVAIEKNLSGSRVVTPELKHAAGLSLLERGELPQGIHRELGAGDPKAVSGPIKAFINEEQGRKILGIPAGTRQQRYAVVDNGDDFYKVAVTKEYSHAQLGDSMGGMRAPGKPALSSTGLCPQPEQQHGIGR